MGRKWVRASNLTVLAVVSPKDVSIPTVNKSAWLSICYSASHSFNKSQNLRSGWSISLLILFLVKHLVPTRHFILTETLMIEYILKLQSKYWKEYFFLDLTSIILIQKVWALVGTCVLYLISKLHWNAEIKYPFRITVVIY